MRLTPRLQRCMDAIVRHQVRTGEMPTYAELAADLGIGRVAAWEMVKRLKAMGAITCLASPEHPNKQEPREIHIADRESNPLRLIVIGEIGDDGPIRQCAIESINLG